MSHLPSEFSQLPANYYAIDFIGRYPVGAVAVVKAKSAHEAECSFLAWLKVHEPELAKKNNMETLGSRLLSEDVTVLKNGDY